MKTKWKKKKLAYVSEVRIVRQEKRSLARWIKKEREGALSDWGLAPLRSGIIEPYMLAASPETEKRMDTDSQNEKFWAVGNRLLLFLPSAR